MRVFALWTPVLATDQRSSWDGGLLADPRVTQLWDRELAVAKWAAATEGLGISPLGSVVYDAFLFFGSEAQWDAAPSGVAAAGIPILGETSKLERAFARLLSEG